MAQQQPEGVYIYISESGARYVAVVDGFGMANMIPWKQPGETEAVLERSWNLNGEFLRLKIAE